MEPATAFPSAQGQGELTTPRSQAGLGPPRKGESCPQKPLEPPSFPRRIPNKTKISGRGRVGQTRFSPLPPSNAQHNRHRTQREVIENSYSFPQSAQEASDPRHLLQDARTTTSGMFLYTLYQVSLVRVSKVNFTFHLQQPENTSVPSKASKLFAVVYYQK